MGLTNWIIQRKIKGIYTNMSNDNKTSIMGAILAAILAAQIDYGKVVHLDPVEVGKGVAVLVTALLGFYTNKKDTPKQIAKDAAKEYAAKE